MFCGKAKEFLSRNRIAFTERDIMKDPAALEELQKLGLMTTPVILVDGEPIVGFDEPKLRLRLKIE